MRVSGLAAHAVLRAEREATAVRGEVANKARQGRVGNNRVYELTEATGCRAYMDFWSLRHQRRRRTCGRTEKVRVEERTEKRMEKKKMGEGETCQSLERAGHHEVLTFWQPCVHARSACHLPGDVEQRVATPSQTGMPRAAGRAYPGTCDRVAGQMWTTTTQGW